MSDLILDARTLTTFQSCRRRFLLAHDWQPIKLRPKSLFDSCLRHAVSRLSIGGDPASCASDAILEFMRSAASPGLDTILAPYQVAKDYCAMLGTIVRAIGKLTLLVVSDPVVVRMNSRVGWRFSSQQDESGILHRWITRDRWSEDALTREAHSWAVLGDIVMARVPMQLHVIDIGQQRAGRRASAWARGWKHPSMASLPMRFRRKDGSSLQGWRPVYLADDASSDPAAWVEQMFREGVAQDSIHHVTINAPTDWVCDDTTRQIMQEAVRMREMIEERGSMGWQEMPMSRGACDGMIPCPFQRVCYTSTPMDPGALGIYAPREAARDCKQNYDHSTRIPIVV